MVLCASNADKSEVKLLEPPSTAEVGDRVKFGQFIGEPATAAQIAKKKIFESLAPLLRTNQDGIAYCGEAMFTIRELPCSAPMPNAIVS
jgi:aminoacyl tRNA synthase complex-interacting multifunctional protein 1